MQDLLDLDSPKTKRPDILDLDAKEDVLDLDAPSGGLSDLLPIIAGEGAAHAKGKAKEFIRPLRVIPAAIKNAALYEIPKGIGGALQLASETGALRSAVPIPGINDIISREAERLGKEAGEVHGAIGRAEVPQKMTEAERHVYGATSSIAQNLPLMATGPAALPLMGALSAGQERAELQAEGVPQKRAIPASAAAGLVEVATEKLPLGVLLKRGVPFVKRLVASYLTDVPGELVATTAQLALNEWAKAPETSLAEFKSKILPALVDTVIQTTIAGPVQTAAVHPFVKSTAPPERKADITPLSSGGPSALPSELAVGAPEREAMEPLEPSTKAKELSTQVLGVESDSIGPGELFVGDTFLRGGKQFTVTRKGELGTAYYTDEQGNQFSLPEGKTLTVEKGSVKLAKPKETTPKKKEIAPVSEEDRSILEDLKGVIAGIEAPGKLLPNERKSTSTLPSHLRSTGLLKTDFDIIDNMLKGVPVTLKQFEKISSAAKAHKEALGFTGEYEGVKGEDLVVGDKFNIRGEEFSVRKIDPDTGKAIVKDGATYEVAPNEDFSIDTGSLKKIARETGFEPPAEPLSLESEEPVAPVPKKKRIEQLGMDINVKGEGLRAPERENKPISMDQLPLGRAVNEAADRKRQESMELVGTSEQGGFLRLGGPKQPKLARIKGQDATVAAKAFGTLQVADKYPVLKPIVNASIDAEMTWNHKRNQMEERITEAFDKAEKPSVVQRLFGKKSTALTDISAWVEGKKAVPEKYKGFVGEVKTIFKEYRDRVVKERTDKILSGLNKRQREIYNRVRNGEDINSIEKMSRTARAAVNAAIKDVDEANQWGLNPETYFPRAFSGSYKFMDERGNILASGETARQAVVRLQEFLEQNPDRRSEQFIGTSTLAELFETRKALKEEAGDPYRSALDYLGTVLPRKQYGALVGKATAAANNAVREAIGESGEKIKVDLRGVASPSPRKKFVGFMQKRGTELKGDVQDPFKVMVSYISAMERKFAVDEMRAKVQPMIEALPASQPNLKEIAEKTMDWAGHYSWENRLTDEGRRKLAETSGAKRLGVSELLRGKPYLATRVFAKGMGGEANLKLMYAPVKSVINAIDGVVHSMFATGVKNWFAGGPWLKTEQGKRIWNAKGHLTGIDMPFTTSGRESYTKSTVNILKPLGMFNWPEIKLNRPRAFAAAFVKATKAGATEAQATDTAIESTRLSQGVYTLSSLPVIVRGPLLKSTYQFKQFMMNRMRFMKTLTPVQWAAYLPYILSISGTKGAWLTIKSILPLTIIGALFIDKGDELAEEMNVKQPYLHRGLPGFVFGQDWAAPSTWQIPQNTKDLMGPLIKDAYNTGQMVVKGMKNGGWTDDEINDYFSQLAPTMKNLYKAFQILTEGKTTKGTKTERKVPNPWEAAANIAGARSVEESAESDTARYVKKKTQDFNERKRVMMDRFFSALDDVGPDGDKTKAMVILKQMQEDGVTDFGWIRTSATARQRTALDRVMKSAPLLMKKEYYDQQKESKNERSRTILPFFKGHRQPEKSAER